MDKYIKGSCENMCPPSEILMRSKEKIIHFYERNKINKSVERERFITEFSRSAAGNKTPNSFELRTKNALNRTVKYLLTEIFQDTRRPYFYCYEFIFDRFRAIRQEIVMQNFDAKTIIELLEPIIMFLAYSSYKLCMEPLASFDPKMCKQHLQECLKKVLSCYDLLDITSDLNEKYSNSNRCFMESLYLLINLGSNEALSRSINVPKKIRDPTFNLSLLISLEFWRGNYYKVLSLMDSLPHVLCAVASLNIQMIRRQMLITFSNGFNNKMLTVPLNWLQRVLIYQQDSTLKNDLSYYNIEVVREGVVFNKSSIDLNKPLMGNFYLDFVNNKLRNINLSNVLLLVDEMKNISRLQNLVISS